MNQQILTTIRTNILECSVISSNSSSVIKRHLLYDPAYAAAYNYKMFTILEASNDELY